VIATFPTGIFTAITTTLLMVFLLAPNLSLRGRTSSRSGVGVPVPLGVLAARVVTLKVGGELLLDGRRIETASIPKELRQIAAETPPPTLLVGAEPSVTLDQVRKFLVLARSAGLTDLRLETGAPLP
jgi:biopolymer transport protein ExbD